MINIRFYCVIFLTIAFFFGSNSQRHPIRDALFLGNQTLANGTVENCIWRRGGDSDTCPDPDISYILYTSGENGPMKEPVDIGRDDWLRTSNWDSTLENIVLIHGYAGGDDTLPIAILRDAYLRTKRFNVLMIDWGTLCKPPCYVAAVHNLRAVARCTAQVLTQLQRTGMTVGSTSCVGHSLGAHVCGIMANFLPFRIERIIGMDPARPLMRNSAPLRLDAGDANFVQILHTNAGHYGEGGRLGHVDVCINGGRLQPYCENFPNENLCSHVWAICYQAESLFKSRMAEPCGRRCPAGARPIAVLPGSPIPIGQAAPLRSSGTYCVSNKQPPFCPLSVNDIGDERCCLSASVNDEQNEIKKTIRRPNALRLARQLRQKRLKHL